MPHPNFDMMKYLVKNIVYPDVAKENNISGRVVVRFTVRWDGEIIDPYIVRGAARILDNEALRVISIMPPWHPGLKDDQPVSTWFTQPITFKLE